MYKLTYESDEEPSKDGGENEQNKKRESESDIYNRSEKPRIQLHRNSYPEYGDRNMGGRERSVTVKSAADAAFGITSKDKTAEPKPKKSFYSLFRDNSVDNFPTKKSSGCNFASGCKILLLILYLLALTAGILILFVTVRRLNEENNILQQRLNSLEIQTASGQFPIISPIGNGKESKPSISEQLTKPASTIDKVSIPVGVPSNVMIDAPPPLASSKDSDSCCNSFEKTLLELKLQVAASTHKNLKQNAEIKNRITNAEKKLHTFDDIEKNVQVQLHEMNIKLDSTIGKSAASLDKLLSLALPNKAQTTKKEEKVAFSVSRVMDDVMTDTHGDKSFASTSLNVIKFNNEVLNVGQNMQSSAGVFVVPSDGVYAFQVSFCTDKNSDKATTVALMQNETILRQFRHPLLSDSSESFKFSFKTPPLSISQKQGRSTNQSPSIEQHFHTAVVQLKSKDHVMLKVTGGEIIDLAARNGQENQSCTKFSGFKI